MTQTADAHDMALAAPPTPDALNVPVSPDAEAADLAAELRRVRAGLLELEARLRPDLDLLHPVQRHGGRNLVHYLALRHHDLRELQRRLARLGLSSLGRCESHVLDNLTTVLHVLRRLSGAADPPADRADGPSRAAGSAADSVGIDESHALLRAATERLLGPRAPGRRVRIMVTLPGDGGADYAFVRGVLTAGADCVRVNCGHDGPDGWASVIGHVRRAADELGKSCRVLMDLAGPNARTGPVASPGGLLRLHCGDTLLVSRASDAPPGAEAEYDAAGRLVRPASIGCTLPEIFRDVRPGDRVLFDDGKMGGVVRSVGAGAVGVEITHARPKGEKLRPEKGINLPDTRLRLAALTEKDLRDLAFVARHADLVGYSFVRYERDVAELRERLQAAGGGHLGVLLKVESREAFANLPSLLLAGMRGAGLGVMIARGDMAVDTGFERMAELQEEILWLCEAAHVPVVWATEVLGTLAKKGRPTRGEVTDAATAARAECVMLNKGPYILRTIRMLDDILRRMQGHLDKKRPLFRELHVASDFLAGHVTPPSPRA